MERSFWREVIDNRYRLPEGYTLEESLEELTVELVGYLSSTDPELRDSFAYNVLARWIIIYGHYNSNELRTMIEWLLPGLGTGLGEQNTDTVFLRSYAALILSLIAYRDVQTNFLEDAEVRSLLDRARHYLLAEQDLRGYVPEKGWANACGNCADLLKYLARNPLLEVPDLTRILDSISDKLTSTTSVVHQHDEDDRLAQVVLSVLRRDMMTVYELTNWLNRFLDWKNSQGDTQVFNEVYQITYHNIKGFLRSLFCYMEAASQLPVEADDFIPELLGAIRVFSL